MAKLGYPPKQIGKNMEIELAISILLNVEIAASGTDLGGACHIGRIALREKQEQEKGCEYCKHGYDLSTGNVCEPSLYIQGNTLIALRYEEPDSEAEIKFCPKCGRRLKED